MRDAAEPSNQWHSFRICREHFDAAVANSVSQDHVCDKDKQCHRMGRQKQQNQRQESRVYKGFTDVETIGRKWRRIVGAVMQPMQFSEESSMVKHTM